GGVVVGTVVVDGPVHELRVTIGADIIDVEEVVHAHLSETQLNPAHRNLGRQIPRRSFFLHHLAAQRYDLADHAAGNVGSCSKRGVAYHVKVGEAGEAERVAQSAAGGRLKVHEDFGCAR